MTGYEFILTMLQVLQLQSQSLVFSHSPNSYCEENVWSSVTIICIISIIYWIMGLNRLITVMLSLMEVTLEMSAWRVFRAPAA